MLQTIACVGSRETPFVVLKWIEETGAALARAGYTIRSGNAPGADQAWARGANSVDPTKVELCLPWEGFEARAIVSGNIVRRIRSTDHKYYDAVKETHPAFGHLSAAALNLHARNAMIGDGAYLMLGSLNPSKPGGGGTGGAFRIAQRYGVITMNVADALVRETIDKRIAAGEDVRGKVYRVTGGRRW